MNKDYIKEFSLDSSTWTYKGFHATLHAFFPLGNVTRQGIKDFLGDAPTTVFFFQDRYIHWYWSDNDLTRLRNYFFEQLKKNPKYLTDLKSKWEEKLQKVDEQTSYIDSIDLSTLDNDELCTLYDNFYESYFNEYKDFMALRDAISMHADRYLNPIFKEILGEDFLKVFPKINTPSHHSFIEQEHIDRDILRKKFTEEGGIDAQLLQKHAQKYFYVQNNYAKGIRLDTDYFEKRIQEDIRNNTPYYEDKLSEKIAERNSLITQYNITGWNHTLLSVVDTFFYIQDTRKKYVLIAVYYQFLFLQELSRRTGIERSLLENSVYEEYRSIMFNGMDEEILRKRSLLAMVVYSGNIYQIFTDEGAQKSLDFFQQEKDDIQELKGSTASLGVVRGRVKKIFKVHDMINLEDGDILVASMTRPEMTPAMKRAAAIVTDEGGITSHAAIVSRELKKPCIIGTKNATKVLQNGDYVEVDADHGVVRILKK